MPLTLPLFNPHTRRLINAAARVQQLLDAGRLLLRVDPVRPGVVEAFNELNAAREAADRAYVRTVSQSPFVRHRFDITMSAPLTQLVAHLYDPRWTCNLDAVLWSGDFKTSVIAVELLHWYARRGPNDPVFRRLGACLHAELLDKEIASTPAEPTPARSVLDRFLSKFSRRGVLNIFFARHG